MSARFCQFLTPLPPLVCIEPTPFPPPDVWRPQSTSINKGKNLYNVVNFLRDSGHLRATSSNNIHAIISCLDDGLCS